MASPSQVDTDSPSRLVFTASGLTNQGLWAGASPMRSVFVHVRDATRWANDAAPLLSTSQAYKNHANFSKSRLATSLEFTVHHYAGQVVYNTSGFVDKNKDQLQVGVARVPSRTRKAVCGWGAWV